VPGYAARIVGHSDYVNWTAWPKAGYKKAPEPKLCTDGYIGILPRYDDTHFPLSCDHTNTTYDVDYTEDLYDTQWNKVLSESEAKLVAIYSWNEYHERSQIEPHINPNEQYVLEPFYKTYHYIAIIPEFPSTAVLSIFMIAALLAVTVRRHPRLARV
jgi:hypothetical protein